MVLGGVQRAPFPSSIQSAFCTAQGAAACLYIIMHTQHTYIIIYFCCTHYSHNHTLSSCAQCNAVWQMRCRQARACAFQSKITAVLLAAAKKNPRAAPCHMYPTICHRANHFQAISNLLKPLPNPCKPLPATSIRLCVLDIN